MKQNTTHTTNTKQAQKPPPRFGTPFYDLFPGNGVGHILTTPDVTQDTK